MSGSVVAANVNCDWVGGIPPAVELVPVVVVVAAVAPALVVVVVVPVDEGKTAVDVIVATFPSLGFCEFCNFDGFGGSAGVFVAPDASRTIRRSVTVVNVIVSTMYRWFFGANPSS